MKEASEMNAAKTLFRITPKSRQLVAQAGNYGLYESVFTITRETSGKGNAVVTHPHLLPSSSYVSINEAHDLTDISKKELRKLCQEGELKAKKVGKNWLILRESLEGYLKKD
jgi:excisionase family DNA binding protein